MNPAAAPPELPSALHPHESFYSIPRDIKVRGSLFLVAAPIAILGAVVQNNFALGFNSFWFLIFLLMGYPSSSKLRFVDMSLFPADGDLTTRLRALFPGKEASELNVRIDSSKDGELFFYGIRSGSDVLISSSTATQFSPAQTDFLLLYTALRNYGRSTMWDLVISFSMFALMPWIPTRFGNLLVIVLALCIMAFTIFWFAYLRKHLDGAAENALEVTRKVDDAMFVSGVLAAFDRALGYSKPEDYAKRIKRKAKSMGLESPSVHSP